MTPAERLAMLLQSTVAGDWSELLSSGARSPEARRGMADRALALYTAFSPAMRTALEEDDEGLMVAITPLREIADAFAIVSDEESEAEFTRRGDLLPTRGAIEWLIRSFDVDQWAGRHGFALNLTGASLLSEAPPRHPEFGPYDPGEAKEILASSFRDVVRVFDAVHELRDTLYDTVIKGLPDSPTGKDLLNSHEWQTTSCSEIVTSRGGLVWTQLHLESDAIPVAVTQVFMAEAMFVATHDPERRIALFPDREWLREFVRASGAYEWLVGCGAELPGWIAR